MTTPTPSPDDIGNTVAAVSAAVTGALSAPAIAGALVTAGLTWAAFEIIKEIAGSNKKSSQ